MAFQTVSGTRPLAQGLPVFGNDNYMLLQLPAWYLQQQQQ